MSEAPTPSDSAGVLLERFLELRAKLTAEPIGDGGRDVCEALTSTLDQAVHALAGDVGDLSDFAVVAVGGYGRSELSLFSDVDLMLLYEGDDPSALASALFRPLWDANLRLGHAVRDVRQAARAARERVDTHTTLLTSRFVAGSEELFDRLTSEVALVTRARPLRRHLVAEEAKRREMSPYLLMATDVKMGRGGLRTLHGFEWERRREGLIGRFSADTGPEERAAHDSLLRVRNALHAAAGRRYDRFSHDLREPAARWLGMELDEVAALFVEAIVTGDQLAARRWPELIDRDDSLARKMLSRLRARQTPHVDSSAPSGDELVSILRSGERGRFALEQLHAAGHLTELFPEWDEVRLVPQLAPFHEHPVGAHLWRTVDEMRSLVEQEDYSQIAREVDSPDALTLAAFLHDIGKGRGGDHAYVGADIARTVCDRIDREPDVTKLVEAGVRHHLLLARTATRRDLDDPAVIDEVADTVGELRVLQLLYLLTVADSKATGPTMWNEWKARLVRTLFVRCAARFGADRPATGTTREEVLAGAGGEKLGVVEAHIDAMPGEYLRSASSDDVLWHVDLIENLESDSDLGTRPGQAADTAVIVGRQHRELRRVVAEAFAANGVDVLEARLLSRVDGIVVDTFRVREDRMGGPVPPDRWDQIREDINSAMAGQLDTGSKVADRVAAYSSVSGPGVDPNVEISIDAASDDGVVVVKCADRIGRLAEILTLLRDSGLEIRLAKLDTREGEVVDTFHVKASSLPGDEVGLRQLQEGIESSIRP